MKTQLYIPATQARIAHALPLLARRDSLWAALAALVSLLFGFQPAHAAVTKAWVQR
jgi:hypothetical protein